jgi:hypothetical protein
MHVIFFHPFADSKAFVGDETINGCMDFAVYLKKKAEKNAERVTPKDKSYINVAHDPEKGATLKGYGADSLIYICGHGDRDADALVGMTSYEKQPPTTVGKSGITYYSRKYRERFRYVLLAHEILEVLKFEGLSQGIREIRFWACRGASSTFAPLFAYLCKDDFPNAKICAYDGDLTFSGGHKMITPVGTLEIIAARNKLQEVKPLFDC